MNDFETLVSISVLADRIGDWSNLKELVPELCNEVERQLKLGALYKELHDLLKKIYSTKEHHSLLLDYMIVEEKIKELENGK